MSVLNKVDGVVLENKPWGLANVLVAAALCMRRGGRVFYGLERLEESRLQDALGSLMAIKPRGQLSTVVICLCDRPRRLPVQTMAAIASFVISELGLDDAARLTIFDRGVIIIAMVRFTHGRILRARVRALNLSNPSLKGGAFEG